MVRDGLIHYCDYLKQNGPFASQQMMIITGIVIAVLGLMVLIFYKKWTITTTIARALLLFYLYVMTLYTLLARTVAAEYLYKLQLFWSYGYIQSTQDGLIVWEVLINCMMLIPVGFLLPLSIESIVKNERKRGIFVLLFGLILTVAIELTQFFTRTGFFEWDDMIHNMIGLFVGYGYYLIVRKKSITRFHWYFWPMLIVLVVLFELTKDSIFM
ncbi:VanZ family protein [Acetobacterium wieringae]|uniref:VanZ like family protein n=1 Tax=Acetobacterium wieringae TaxID=52694 RepID=A0A1F2PDG7_9FIRM|nr:VanZ family protein [Acetobacterium wieringae]OFV69044.1 VanZ like family protein [Acetobacterium wieringae]